MLNLVLSVCPICETRHSVFRQSAVAQDHEMVWYECRRCSSFLLWAGKDHWIYQKVGRHVKTHLLKQTLTTAELEAMAEAAAQNLSSVSEAADEGEWVGSNFERKYLKEGRIIYTLAVTKK